MREVTLSVHRVLEPALELVLGISSIELDLLELGELSGLELGVLVNGNGL